MKERTKEIITDGFGSLVSNASALRGAKAGPFWLTLVMFILGIILPVIPMFVAQANTNGSSFLNSYSYGLEKTVSTVACDLKFNRNAEFVINQDHLLSITEAGTDVNFSNFGTTTPYATYLNKATNQYDLTVYLSDATTEKEKNVVVEAINKIYYASGTTEVTAGIDKIYRPNFIVLYKNGIFMAIYSNNSTQVLVSSYNGDFKTIEPANNCLEKLLTVKNVNPNLGEDAYTNGVYKNFKVVLDRSYDTLKIRNTWVSSSIYLGIYFALCVVLGFIMWLITRGKNNPNNYFSIWLCMKIQGRLVFCPGLITLIVGFFLTSQTPLIFIMTVGLRIMWISMKELRPIQQ